MKLTIPTILTILRLVLLPLLVWLLFVGYYWWALGLYSFGAFTDFLDGWIARKYDQITPFGTFLDPISDKIYVCTLFITLVAAQHISGVWITAVIVILAREFMVAVARVYLPVDGVSQKGLFFRSPGHKEGAYVWVRHGRTRRAEV